MNQMSQPPRIFHLMQLAHRALFRAADQLLQESLGLTAVQQGALFVIGKQEPCKPSAIAKALDMNKSAVTTLVTTERGAREPRNANGTRYTEGSVRRRTGPDLAERKSPKR